MSSLTSWVLAHKRTVIAFWVVLTIAGMAAAGPATDALEPEFSVPDKEGWETNEAIAAHYDGTGGDTAPLIPVVTLPEGESVDSPGGAAPTWRRSTRGSPRRCPTPGSPPTRRPATRPSSPTTAGRPSPSSTRSRTRTRRSARTRPPRRPRAPRSRAPRSPAQPVHLTGFDALFEDSGADDEGPGLLLEAVLGGLGALAVLAFVFASFLARRADR